MNNAEPDQEVTYSISKDQDVFVVEGNALVLKNALDYETQSMYNVTIMAQDDGTPPAQVIHSQYLMFRKLFLKIQKPDMCPFSFITLVTHFEKINSLFDSFKILPKI